MPAPKLRLRKQLEENIVGRFCRRAVPGQIDLGGEWFVVDHSSVECDGVLAQSTLGVVEMEADDKLARRLLKKMVRSAAFPEIPPRDVLDRDAQRGEARSEILHSHIAAGESNRQHRLPSLALHAFGQQCHDGL